MPNFRNLRFFGRVHKSSDRVFFFKKIQQHRLLVSLFSSSSYSFKIAFLLVSYFGGSMMKWTVN